MRQLFFALMLFVHTCYAECCDPFWYWPSSDQCCCDCQIASECGKCGAYFPECPTLFRPFVADPRQLTYSAGWRFDDNALTTNVIPISFWDRFPIYRWCRVDLWCLKGQLELDVDGGIWAVFDPCTYSSPLMNADYYVSGTVMFASGCWQFRMRYYHISSHLGDEFLLNHKNYDRRNPSWETLDLFASYDLTKEIRLYGGAGVVVNQDNSFKRDRLIVEAGVELRLLSLGFYSPCRALCGHPYYGMHFRYKPDFHGTIDQTYVVGYEFAKLTGYQRRVRAWVEYHDGFSVDGQFSKDSTNYVSIRLSYGD